MMGKRWLAASLLFLFVAASAEKQPEERTENHAPHYVLMQDDLTQLKTDFNAAVDQVRLVFIVGPT